MPINSRQKGKRVEREAAHKMNEVLGASDWKRTQQNAGSPDAPDIKSDNFPRLIIEVKGCQQLNIFKAMEQSVGYCTKQSLPVVMHKKNGTEFLITIRADDMLKFARYVSNSADDMAFEADMAGPDNPPDGYEIQQNEKYGGGEQ